MYIVYNVCVFHSTAEKVSSLGKDWHKFCLKCERCSKTLTPGGHAEHDGKPYCHKPCYAALYGPKGVNIGGAGSYVYETPVTETQTTSTPPRAEERKTAAPPRGPVKGENLREPINLGSSTAIVCMIINKKILRINMIIFISFCPAASFSSFSGEPNICPRCNKTVYFAEKVMSLGKYWHRPCLRCERCSKTLAPGGHAEHDGQPYCHKPCYAVLFGPKGVNTGGMGSYIYEEPNAEPQP
ncbi:cysteine-rich protein 2-like isoform X1 [Ictalurus furcatus]|uniref:cysteine-rich protein 2-like isoform X1 n=1 Tax=Ictalurus furcatus TaxID=66913 RepID=UPI0023509FE6|nr:cysteine-rich protein 2-like isoform X1 [Ictalurus furcatus]